MKEIESLIARSRKYLESAEILLKSGDYESSVSRVYYAMFYSVEALLLTEGVTVSSHKGVISAFGERFIKTGVFGKEMSKELSRAFEKRQLGDYEYTFVISEDEAREMFEKGRNFVETLIKYLEKRGLL
ncbi:HEPN domain protein [uncultured archaeon]|nr:HEPN domain protein [uncultured archaeon]